MPFDSTTAAIAGKLAKERSPYQQAVELQRQLLVDALSPETSPVARAQVARAWDVLEDRKRVLKGKGAPKQVDYEAVKPKRQSTSSGFSESPAAAKVKRAKVQAIQVETPPNDTPPA